MAREAKIDIVRYESVRDPEQGACLGILSPEVFHHWRPKQYETWFMAVSRERVRA